MVNKRFFGPYHTGKDMKLISYQESLEVFFNEVDGYRSKELYKHSNCTGTCTNMIKGDNTKQENDSTIPTSYFLTARN